MRTQFAKQCIVYLFVVGLSVSAPLSTAAPQQGPGGPVGGVPQIEHFPVTFGVVGKPISLEARVVAPGRVVIYLRLYFKSVKEQAFKYIDMRPGAQGYLGQIPASTVHPPVMQYFLVALLSDHTVINYPSKNPYGQPFEIMIQENGGGSSESEKTPDTGTGIKSQEKSLTPPATKPPVEVSPQLLDKIEKLERPMAEAPEDTANALSGSRETSRVEPSSPILVLSPEPFSTVAANEVVIAASFVTEAAIDSSSVKLLLDGRNVASQAQISAVMLSYSPLQIAGGEHTVVITARDEFGKVVGPLSWRFHVAEGAGAVADDRAKIHATGMVYAEMRREKFGGINLNNNNVGADLSGNTGPLNYSASAYFTSLEDKMQQPRNRFAISAGLPWLNLTLGDAIPYFDELILWGRRVRGLQAGLHTGIINFDFVSGETVRAINPANGQFGTYRQTLMGLRPSFGSRNGFLWGFTLLKVRDDTHSLTPGNVNLNGGVTPKDNLVLGTDVNFTFDHRRFEIKASGAWSLLTGDIAHGAMSQDSVKKIAEVDLPFDPKEFEKWFILNESTSPLDPSGKTSLAYQFTVQCNYFNQFLTAGYKQIGSEYVSLGNSFLRNDLRGFFISDRWRLLRNRAHLTLGLESYDDHFNSIDGRPATSLTTWQIGCSIFWDPNLPSLNFNFRNHSRNNSVDSGSVVTVAREDNATRDFLFSLNYEVTAFDLDHTLMLSLMSSNRVDHIKRTIPGDVASNIKTISLRTRYQIPITSTLTFATNNNDIAGGQDLFKYNMFSGRVDYDFSQQRTEPGSLRKRAYLAFSTTNASGGTAASNPSLAVVDYNQTAFQFGGSLQFKTRHELVLDIHLVNYKDHGFRTVNGIAVSRPSKNSSVRAYYAYRF
ncbi:MAG: hypothetical protein ONB44_09415 [candidate division KSB1 bacterium]|nr:hypothetical protein [candidate division KSB1 bacterium]MDZ7302347.1 hypothetical protein [candidate division KSB1 bacterium]MDZ7311199.1 hypothetical protein [candidate division KSB1 bacterium]